jgi:hypothetical protein
VGECGPEFVGAGQGAGRGTGTGLGGEVVEQRFVAEQQAAFVGYPLVQPGSFGRVVPGVPAGLQDRGPRVRDQRVEVAPGDADGGDRALGQRADVVEQVAVEAVARHQGQHDLLVAGAVGQHGADRGQHDALPAGAGAGRHPAHRRGGGR